MKVILILTYLAITPIIGLDYLGQSSGNNCEAKIEYNIDKEKSLITIEAKAVNNGEKKNSFRYKLVVEKKGPSGTSSNSQSGEVEANAGETVSLSTSSLDYREGNKYSITLSVISEDGNKCRAKKTLSYKE